MNFDTVQEKLDNVCLNGSFDLTLNEYKVLLTDKINSNILLKLKKGLSQKKINPDKVLQALLQVPKKEEHLCILGFLIRSGADVNMYLEIKDIQVHILVYIYLVHNKEIDTPLRNTIVTMLKLSGSNHDLEFSPGKKISVINYLNQSKINHILPLISHENIVDILDKKLLTKVITLLDREDLVSTKDDKSSCGDYSLKEIVRDRSVNVFRKLYNKINLSGIILLCIKYYNSKIFKISMNLGIPLKYHEVNMILLHISPDNSSKGIELIKAEFEDMLNSYISHGGKIDNYHKGIVPINLNTENILNNLINPLLKKSPEEIPEPIMTSLFVKKKYIEKGAGYSRDPRLKNIKTDRDFLDLSYYDDAVFTPDMFEKLLDNKNIEYFGKNYTMTQEYLDSLKIQRSLVKRLSYTVSPSAIQRNPVDEEYFSKMEKAFDTLIRLNTGKDAGNSTMYKMDEILRSIDHNLDMVPMLAVEHYRRTFAITCYENLGKYMELIIKMYS